MINETSELAVLDSEANNSAVSQESMANNTDANAEEPFLETSSLEVLDSEEPVLEATNVDMQQIEEPVLEATSTDISKIEEPILEATNVDMQKIEEPVLEATSTDIPKLEEPVLEATSTDLPKLEESVAEDKNSEAESVEQANDTATTEPVEAKPSVDVSKIATIAPIGLEKKATASDIMAVKPIELPNNKQSKGEQYVDKLVESKLNAINRHENIYGTGKVVSIRDFIIEVVGLEDVAFNEKVKIENKGIGYVVQMKPNRVSIAILSVSEKINIGDSVYQTNELLEGDFSFESFGRVIDIFGNDKLTNKKFSNTVKMPIELPTVPIMERTEVSRPLQTGIMGIDLLYPIGKGQRQLIIGDKKTGKTQICLDTIANQVDKNVICIYVAIGKTKKEVKEIYYDLLRKKANAYTIIITAFYDDMPSILTLTPYFALSVAEYYMKQKYDVLVVLDDLKKHADAYRQISLISGKAPGRDAYPADIFYFHSRLLEKGCQHMNGGSVTILPVIETKSGDITDYISTNVISITDGQIVLSRDSFLKGEKPAINYGLSVSRLGGAVQEADMKELGANVRRSLLSYLETRDVYELANEDEMSKELQEKLFQGANILKSLIQYKYSPLTKEEMIQKIRNLPQFVAKTEDTQAKAEQPEQNEAAQTEESNGQET